jgi:hypothetical protein
MNRPGRAHGRNDRQHRLEQNPTMNRISRSSPRICPSAYELDGSLFQTNNCSRIQPTATATPTTAITVTDPGRKSCTFTDR